MSPVLSTAIMRGLYTALGTGISTALLTWAATDDIKTIVIASVGAALTVLGFRGGGEGLYDRNRANTGNMNAGDVPMASPDVTVTKP